MKYKEIRKLYKDAGWTLARQNGSHQIWKNGGQIQVIAGKDSDTIPPGTFNQLHKPLGI